MSGNQTWSLNNYLPGSEPTDTVQARKEPSNTNTKPLTEHSEFIRCKENVVSTLYKLVQENRKFMDIGKHILNQNLPSGDREVIIRHMIEMDSLVKSQLLRNFDSTKYLEDESEAQRTLCGIRSDVFGSMHGTMEILIFLGYVPGALPSDKHKNRLKRLPIVPESECFSTLHDPSLQSHSSSLYTTDTLTEESKQFQDSSSLYSTGYDSDSRTPSTLHAVRPQPIEWESKVAKVLSGTIAQFALDLLGQVKSGDPNVVFSPFSISSALAIVYAGAESNTARQMKENIFKGIEVDSTLHNGFKGIIKLVAQTNDAYTLKTANRLYIEEQYADLIKEDFLNILKATYASTIKAVHMPSAAAEINQWVKEQTNGRIKDLVSPNSLQPENESGQKEIPSILMVNAIYFKGDWNVPFEKQLTVKKPFFFAPHKMKEVKMMRSFNENCEAKVIFGYHETEKIQILNIPYKRDLAAFIFLPRDFYGLSDFEEQLSGKKLLELLSKSHEKEYVFAAVPKFKMEASYPDLRESLETLGISDMFDKEAAELGKIIEIIRNPAGEKFRSLIVKKVIHKAFIKFNEKGAEAAAATAVEKGKIDSGDPPRPKIFIADHPFLFLILDTRTDAILFIGRYSADEKDDADQRGTASVLSAEEEEEKMRCYFHSWKSTETQSTIAEKSFPYLSSNASRRSTVHE